MNGLKSSSGTSIDQQHVILKRAIETHESAYKKKFDHMTPFERSKIQDTYSKLLRNSKYGKAKLSPTKTTRFGVEIPKSNPVQISENLSQCMNAQ